MKDCDHPALYSMDFANQPVRRDDCLLCKLRSADEMIAGLEKDVTDRVCERNDALRRLDTLYETARNRVCEHGRSCACGACEAWREVSERLASEGGRSSTAEPDDRCDARHPVGGQRCYGVRGHGGTGHVYDAPERAGEGQ